MKSVLKKIRNKLKRNKTYSLSDTCQIPKLADLYLRYIGYKTNGYFVEVGAYDGEYVSNTSGLADIGWRGIYIEPVKSFYEACIERHKNNKVKVLNVAIGEKEGEIEMHIGGPLSSASKETVANFEKLDWAKGIHTGEKQRIKSFPLEQVLTEYQVPKSFDLLSVDVEGYEWPVFKSFDVGKWQPKMILVELHDNNLSYKHEWEDCEKIAQLLAKTGYKIVYKDYSNTVFVHTGKN